MNSLQGDRTRSHNGVARVLCCSSQPVRLRELTAIVTKMGHLAESASTDEEYQAHSGVFNLALFDLEEEPSFPSGQTRWLLEDTGRHIERGLLLSRDEGAFGYHRAFAHACSDFCTLDLDENGQLTAKGKDAIHDAIVESLATPPYEYVDFFDTVNDRDLHSVVESSMLPILVLDTQDRIWFANLSAHAMLKRPTFLLRGLAFDKLLADDQPISEYRRALRELRASARMGETLEVRMKDLHGREFDALLLFNRIFGPTIEEHIKDLQIEFGQNAPDYLVGVNILDITDRKKAEAEKKRLEEELRQAYKMESIGQMASGIAHDFNNFLQVISGHATLIQDQSESDCPYHEDLEGLLDAADRASHLVRQLLTFSRRESSNLTPQQLNESIDNLSAYLRSLVGDRIAFEFHPGEDVPFVNADLAQLEQILSNLCVNARDAMPDGGTLRLETGSRTLREDECLMNPDARPGLFASLSVADTGAGIPQEILNRVFEPFFTTKPVGKGTGLGLATVYGIVRQHRGIIRLTSEVGAGTTFHIFLPSTVQADTEEAPAPAPETPVRGEETVLIAEDEDQVRILSRRVLERAGYSVMEARNGAEAIQLFDEHEKELDIVLLDAVMPVLPGRAVCEHIRKRNKSLPILFCTGFSRDFVLEDLEKIPSTWILLKPFAPRDLLRKVREILDLESWVKV